ncbi:hypothetical protein MKK84_24775 [Methylobacterium sp. E-065]|uniref:hypothetical protein n=1 Tax=Methylobacterium sp. E-065 TaxID=2836583 RepID=UPI001FB9884B|nr:hypothetical protein [Methylobacterium sp. E-065]MCJ2020604.1 hypothetical protein [Methylobacterium sp. E-065]
MAKELQISRGNPADNMPADYNLQEMFGLEYRPTPIKPDSVDDILAYLSAERASSKKIDYIIHQLEKDRLERSKKEAELEQTKVEVQRIFDQNLKLTSLIRCVGKVWTQAFIGFLVFSGILLLATEKLSSLFVSGGVCIFVSIICTLLIAVNGKNPTEHLGRSDG